MEKLEVCGGNKLKGEVQISGSKNATLPLMAATLLTDEECIIENVPYLSDVYTMIRLLENLGKQVDLEHHVLTIKSNSEDNSVASYKLVKTMRASFCVLGPLLAKRGYAKVSLPGGCVIGVRPVDLHIKGMRALGADVHIKEGYCYAEASELRGTEMFLGGPFGSSVLATANVLMAASKAKGETVIDFAACEPEVLEVIKVLKKMGVKIEGESTPQLIVQGKDELLGFKHKVISDRIEAGTFMTFALATSGSVLLKDVCPSHLGSVIDVLNNMGQKIEKKRADLYIDSQDVFSPVNITTFPYPGFPTDLQAQFMVLLSRIKGFSVITEKVYPDRFMHVPELNRMGAKISRFGPLAVVEGIDKFTSAEVMASDLRASACLVAAGLAAVGKTIIHRIYHLDRGYENFIPKLRGIGAEVKRVKE